jgi:ATP-dependent helicase/nuclease subunit A
MRLDPLHAYEQQPLFGDDSLEPPAERPRALTGEQERAVARREGSLMLAAGAGSGKTSVLVERFVRAVCEDGVSPGRILAITFTERAAGELRERVRARFLQLGDRDAAREAEAANVSTFHGFCARLLRIHPLQAGVEPGFQILDETLADRLRMLAFRDALGGFLEGERADAVDLVAAYGADPLRSMVLGAYAQLRSQGQREPRLPSPRRQPDAPRTDTVAREGAQSAPPAGEPPSAAALRAHGARACALIADLVERFGEAYSLRKHMRTALDFDDLELDARELLERRADVRELWAERFELLMVDEFQDSNARQLQVLAALDRDNLFTVGDELQSIYGFRHADVNLFRRRREQLSEHGASLALTRNFRSLPPVLAAVQRIFAERMGERFASLTPVRQPQPSAEPLVELLLTDKRGWDGFPRDENLEGMAEATSWRQAEARLLADRVAELVASGCARAGDVVVLLRALGDMPVYESALRGAGLPTLAGVGGFWSHQQVGDLLAWLRSLANPLDELALYSTLASPLVGVSGDGLALIASAARESGGGVWQTLSDGACELDRVLSPEDRARVVAFRELFAAERLAVGLHPLSELLRRALVASGYEAHVLSLNWGELRLANVHKLIRIARRFEAQEGRDLRGFLDHVAHIEVGLGAREADALVGDGELDAVRLMSIHAAKGLEFPVVCVADLGRDPNLRMPNLLVDGPGRRVGLRLHTLTAAEPQPALDFLELSEEHRAAQEEEEDRVLYVACTRAENRLLLCGSVSFERFPSPKPGVAPIAWLAPALVPDAPKLVASQECPTGPIAVAACDGLLVRCVFNAPGALGESPAGASLASSSCRDSARAGEVLGGRRSEAARVGGGAAMGLLPGDADIASLVGVAQNAPPAEDLRKSSAGGNTWASTPNVPQRTPLADPDGTMSYTALAELERCGYRFYLERVLGLAENGAAARYHPHDGRIEPRTRGTIVHMLLESVDFKRPRPPSTGDVAAVARRIGVSVRAGEREQIAALIAAALDSEPARLLAASRRARREHPFAFSLAPHHLGEPLVTGVLDLIVERSDGSSLVVDYKSDHLSGEENLELLVQHEYGFQRLLYALAAIEQGAQEVEVAHWFLERPATWVGTRFAAHEAPRLREQLVERVSRAKAKGYSVTDTPHRGLCLTCPGRGGLCSWGETRTMSERSATLEFHP